MSQPVRTMLARLPRPWRRRRPVVVQPAVDLPAVVSSRRSADLNPGGLPKLGRVHRGATEQPGKHRAPEQPAPPAFAGNDYPTVPIRAITAETVAIPRLLVTAFAPLAGGAR
ncbi:hypothetical protein [Klenkia brasiliensis]|uniref:Uncharacterized protein n=1 Tax=Klenkia brasiliensis TaxID=333142 RepID=A0A1G7YK01_9ACTN|nr:hypothetical protein [Klenkia brasiliensis]SDG96160.1 hypothetical protein SAMN05660324_3970 [Klenkia brasiliensis]